MSAKQTVVAALALMFLVSCSRQSSEFAQPPSSPLQQFTQGLGVAPACARVIPIHWSPSLPVPILVDRRLHYRVFFSGWSGRPDTGIVIHDAEGDALFSAEGVVIECRQRTGTGRIIPAQPPMVMSLDELDARERALYGEIEKMGLLYANAAPPGESERTQMRAFSQEFSVLSGQSHSAAYRALNPEFWGWVEKNSGSPIW